MNKTVTGCIVTYNNIATIDNAIGSLLRCTEAPFRLYVVDNGSTDGTTEHIEKTYPEVTVIKSGSNVGFGAGHDLIMDRLDSDYHVIINPDIIVKDDVISILGDYMEQHPDIGMLSPEIRFPDAGFRSSARSAPPCITSSQAGSGAAASRARPCANTQCSTVTSRSPSISRTPRAASCLSARSFSVR